MRGTVLHTFRGLIERYTEVTIDEFFKEVPIDYCGCVRRVWFKRALGAVGIGEPAVVDNTPQCVDVFWFDFVVDDRWLDQLSCHDFFDIKLSQCSGLFMLLIVNRIQSFLLSGRKTYHPPIALPVKR